MSRFRTPPSKFGSAPTGLMLRLERLLTCLEFGRHLPADDVTLHQGCLLAEDRSPPGSIWKETLVASRLLEYEVWNRIHAGRLARSHGEAVRALIDHLTRIELVPPDLPFPVLVPYARCHASGYARQLAAARALDIPIFGP
jgi:hypothetical protein